MPRKNRIEKAGFYHIVNRGVARERASIMTMKTLQGF